MIFRNRPTPKNGSQKLADIFLTNNKSNELWSELDETSQAAVSGGVSFGARAVQWLAENDGLAVKNTTFTNNTAGNPY
ncbi:hypothetical protein QUB33_03145 [Microcoleus sp. B3-A4]|uniref:hypothetical protein n=1 Tax=Microcoleus sp. B3-A4 TaxID=2818653 RepID=UPI002FCF2620